MSSKLALLDRDGTLIEHVHYLSDPEQVRLLPETVEGLLALKRLNFRLVLVSNQSGVGRGYFDEHAVHRVNERMQELLRPHGAELDLMLFCPHAPQDHCPCRKPKTGMAEQACQLLSANLKGAIMVGDSDCDMELAQALGIPGYRVGTPQLPGLAGLLHQL
ncbi:MAG: HAD family hydrolase [Candidatus Eremiobacteraeota bacterium]|nr:HAD family hydrolase [Candidatus Eremiobacteraeota bacterium]MCW5868360.1 HAD family hydrolase [Candidatus Eremiobacteraeota bacterium]